MSSAKENMKKADVFIPSALQAALLTGLPFLILLVVAPALIYTGNPQYLDHQYQVVLHLAAVHLGVLLMLFLVFRVIPGLRRICTYVMGTLGVYLLVICVFSSTALKELPHGGLKRIEEPWGWVLFESLLAVALLILIRVVRSKDLVELTSFITSATLLVLPLFVVFEGLRVDDQVSRWPDKEIINAQNSVQSHNVYHLIFDGFDGTQFENLINNLGIAEGFNGFTWYPNAYSNYTSTALSFPSFMTGRVFDEAITDQLGGVIGRTQGIIPDIVKNGITVSQYNSYFVNNHVDTQRRFSTLAIERAMYGNLRHIIQLLDLSILVITPTGLKQEVIVDSRGAVSNLLRNTSQSIADWTRNPPMLSRVLFLKMLEDITQLPDRGQYLNAHFLLPHTPPTLSVQCNYEPNRPQNNVALIEQHMCATLSIAQFADRLRELKKFKNSTIIIHSDHGAAKPERPLLLVKYLGASNESLMHVPHPVQLLDIAPTVREILGLEYAKLEGIPLPHVQADTRRQFKIRHAVR